MLLATPAVRRFRIDRIFSLAAERYPCTVVILDAEPGIAPHLGRRVLVSELAALVDEYAARLYAAGVRVDARVVVCTAARVDITILTCAVARLGALPVVLSPELSPATATALVTRAQARFPVTDERMLAAAPVHYRFERLPLTATAKVKRLELARTLADGS